MKYICNGLFGIGIIVAFVGISMADADVLLALKVAPAGVIMMFLGWLLDELFVEVEDDYTEYLRHLR